jgi:hypothetical protein
MKTDAIEIEDKIDELLVCLDKDIEHIQNNLSDLDRLRTLVIKRDDAALGRLLEEIQSDPKAYKQNESKRQSIRMELAKSFGCAAGEMTLSRLELFVTDQKKSLIIQRKAKLKTLIEKLRKEYLSTAKLLSECARFNNMLLRSIFDLGNPGMVYYNANGTTKKQNESAFVNMKL